MNLSLFLLMCMTISLVLGAKQPVQEQKGKGEETRFDVKKRAETQLDPYSQGRFKSANQDDKKGQDKRNLHYAFRYTWIPNRGGRGRGRREVNNDIVISELDRSAIVKKAEAQPDSNIQEIFKSIHQDEKQDHLKRDLSDEKDSFHKTGHQAFRLE